jgi:hypothetical protein
VQEGLAYHLVPVNTGKSEEGEFGIIDHEIMYNNMMNNFTWGNAAEPSVYLDENNRRMFSNFRRIFGSLGKNLISHGDTIRAVEVARRSLEIVPPDKMPYDFFCIGAAEVLLRAGKTDEGEKLVNQISDYSKQYLEYSVTLDKSERFGLDYPTGINMQALLDIYNMSLDLNLTSISSAIEPELNAYYSKLYMTK